MTHAVPRPTRRTTIAVAAAAAVLVAVLLLLLIPDLALARPYEGGGAPPGAANGAQEAGRNLGQMLRGVVGPVVWGIAAMSGVAVILRRDVMGAITLLIVTGIIGLFVTSEGETALQALSKMFSQVL